MPGLSRGPKRAKRGRPAVLTQLVLGLRSSGFSGARSAISTTAGGRCVSPAARQRTLAALEIDSEPLRARSCSVRRSASRPMISSSVPASPAMTTCGTACSDTASSPECRRSAPQLARPALHNRHGARSCPRGRRRRPRSRELCHHRPPLRQPADQQRAKTRAKSPPP